MDASELTHSHPESFPWPVEWRKGLPNPDWKQWKHRRAHDGKWNPIIVWIWICLQMSHVHSKSKKWSIVSYCNHYKVTCGYVWFIYPLSVWCLVDPACATSKPSWTACPETWGNKISCTRSWWFFAIVPKVPNRKFHWRIKFVCSYLPKITPQLVRLASCSSGATRGGQWRRAAVPSTKPRPILTHQGHPQGFLLLAVFPNWRKVHRKLSGKPL